MKNKIWVLIAIAGFVLALSACEHEVKNNYVPSKHLGIGEKCPKSTECGLKSYGTVDKQDIQRVGELDASKGFTDASIQNAANTIMKTYGDFTGDQIGNVALNKVVQILKDGETKYKNQELKVVFNDPSIASYLKDLAGPVLVYCPSPNAGHLGIDEDCTKNTGKCGGVQNYNTSTGENAFPKPIYRVGPISDFDANVLAKTVDDIMKSYTDPGVLEFGDGEKQRVDQRLDFVQIYKTGGYTWKNKVLGLRAGLRDEIIWGYIGDISSPSDALTPTAQLQPAGNIRLAGGKKKTERFPVIAGGDATLPRAIVMNRRLVYSCT